jgi:peroxiredoxin
LSIQFRHAVVATVVALFLLGACSTYSGNAGAKESVKPEKERNTAPDFTLKDADGRAVKLSDYRGKVVLLNFWATWCGPCKIEIPWFVEFEQMHKDKGFAVLGVSMDEEGWDAVRPFISAMRVNYRTVIGTDLIAQQYGGVDALPTSFIIDREGKIASTHIGLVRKSDYEKDIQELLAIP